MSDEMILEADGLLSVKGITPDALSLQADTLARQHPTTAANVHDFHALTGRYYDKLVAEQFPGLTEPRNHHNHGGSLS